MPTFEKKFSLSVPSSTENLVMIRDFVKKIAEQAGLDETQAGEVELAVDEACSNVIEHAYGKDVTKEVSIRAIVDSDSIQIEVVDTGKGFEPAEVQQKDLRQLILDRQSGGLGMGLMRRLMDEVQYQIIPGVKNELRMVKRLKH